MRDMNELNQYRDHQMERKLWGGFATDEFRRDGGFFWIPCKGTRKGLKVIASSGRIPTSDGWDHVSVSLPNRTPSWDEMDMVKRLFFFPHEVAFQLHPEESDHISNHRFTLHIWRNINHEIPLPPPEMVGLKDLGELKSVSIDEVHAAQSEAIRRMKSSG